MAAPLRLRCYYSYFSSRLHGIARRKSQLTVSLMGIGSSNKFSSEALHQTVSLHSRSQNQYHAPFDFNFNLDDPLLPEFLELLKKVAHSSSQAEGLRSSNFQANRDLICSAIWALREEWKPALLAFKWNCHLNDEKVCNLMVWVSATHGKFSTAWCIIRDMHHSSLSTRQAMLIMIDRYASANNTAKAIQTFNFMDTFRLTPDQEAFHALLAALCKCGNVEEAEEFMLLSKKLFPLETKSFNIILNGWCNITKDVYEAKRVWREMSKYCITPDDTSYSYMISCFSKEGNLFDSLRLYDQMKKRGWTPGIEIYNSLVYVLTRANCLKEALRTIDNLKEQGLQPDSSTFNAMILPLCETGKLAEARVVFNTMVEENVCPTTETYHAFFEGVDYQGSLEFLSRMKDSGLGPNKDSFLIILTKFLKLKQPVNAVKIWTEMKAYDLVPSCEHYRVMVEELVNCRWFIKARYFYEEMISNGCSADPKLNKLFQKEVPVRGDKGKQNVKNAISSKSVKYSIK
ncbi:pentatricopeptide repeat-containing protein At1g80880, mitochondrial [Vigna radiata var. radiata]|uniref:Pentatricopeptide repeat-containing protein At1g80880, mitochondrial n=1 Tax=Vigna radiata var. radiata TaxID=3916 RepID=A0A1S3U3L5_VIGRR|nr:pentatricopeptide repeat-containing protein At1g80880, mitochondrial [Vigna radiata var. radiata]